MKTIITEKIEKRLVTAYISEDNIEFKNLDDCLEHELKIKMSRLSSIMKCDSLDDYANFNGSECYEDSTYTWYKPSSKVELELLRDAYGTIDKNVLHSFHDGLIGKWICIERRDDQVWFSTLDDAIAFAEMVLNEIMKAEGKCEPMCEL